MSQIVWTKEATVICGDGQFKMFLSQHKNDEYYCTLIWYSKKGSWTRGESVELDFNLPTFKSTTEINAISNCRDWVVEHLDPNAKFSEFQIRKVKE